MSLQLNKQFIYVGKEESIKYFKYLLDIFNAFFIICVL